MKKENIIRVITVVIILAIIVGIYIFKNMDKPTVVSNQEEVAIYYNEESLPTLVEFGSTRCEACRIMIPILEKIEKDYEGKIVVKKVDVYKDYKNTKRYNIRIIPTQLFFDSNGKVIYRHEGVLTEDEIVEKLTEMGVR